MLSAPFCLALLLLSAVQAPAGDDSPGMARISVPQTFFEADLVHVGQAPVESAGIVPGELVDVVLPAGPDGTGTSFVEPFQYQLGASYQRTGRPHRMLVAYHGFGSSASSVATQSTLDELCNQRGWVYLSVTGLDDKLFGTELSQQHTEAAIRWMLDNHNVDPDRIVMVGFSMGAGVAINFAARHRDPDGIVLAALGLVAVSADWTSAWEIGGAGVKAVLENPLNFGVSPSQDPFAYQRWSGAFHANGGPFSIGTLQAGQSMASNLGATPVYLTWDTGDPTLYVAEQCATLATYLAGLGGEVTVKKVSGTLDPATGVPAPHSWALLKVNQMLNAFDGKTAERRPSRMHALVAEDSVAGSATIEQRAPGSFSAADIDIGSVLRVSGVENAECVALDAGGLTADRRVEALPADGEGFDLRLSGFATRPSYVLAAGGGLVQDVRADPLAEALVVPVPPEGLDAAVVAREDWNGTLTVTPDPAPVGAPIQLHADGPPSARSVWLVFGGHEVLSPVLADTAVLGVRPRPPSFIRRVDLDADGDLVLTPTLPATLPVPGGHIHVQALFLDEGQSPVATSNVWMLRWSE